MVNVSVNDVVNVRASLSMWNACVHLCLCGMSNSGIKY